MEPTEIKKEEAKPELKPEPKKSESKIKFDDFAKVEIRIGKILSAEKVPETDKLVKLSVDFKEEKPRQIISGIALFYPDLNILIGKKCAFATNLEPRVIKGLESNGMILAAKSENAFSLLEVLPEITEGTTIS